MHYAFRQSQYLRRPIRFHFESKAQHSQRATPSRMSPKSFPAARCAFFLFFAIAHPVMSADDEKWVGVACYSPRPEYAPDGQRVFAILKEHHIRAVGTASASAQIHVSSRQAAEARKLVAEAIEKEKLRVTLLR